VFYLMTLSKIIRQGQKHEIQLWIIGGIILRGGGGAMGGGRGNISTRRRTFPCSTSSTINPIRTGPESNVSLFSYRTATKHILKFFILHLGSVKLQQLRVS